MTITASRVLFGVASGIFVVSFFQDTSYIFRDEYQLNWGFYLGMVITLIQSALLALPVFLVGKRVVAVISIVSVYFLQILFGVIIIVRDLEFLFDFGIREFIQYWILPMFMIPNFVPDLSFDSLVLESSAYLRLIGIIVGLLGVILTFVGAHSRNQEATTTARSSGAQIFIAGQNSGKRSSHVNSTEGIDQVERLGDLLKKGLITQEEFDFKKRQILGL